MPGDPVASGFVGRAQSPTPLISNAVSRFLRELPRAARQTPNPTPACMLLIDNLVYLGVAGTG